jgi:general stress protein 26
MNAGNKKFRDLLKSFDTAVLVTQGEFSGLTSRPVAIADVEDGCDLWLIARENSAKTHEIAVDTRVLVICQNGWTSCVTVSGMATLSHDRIKIRELWKPSYKDWFSKGVDQPGLVLVRVSGERGEYWDHAGTDRITISYQALSPVVTAKSRTRKESDRHGRAKLSHGV